MAWLVRMMLLGGSRGERGLRGAVKGVLIAVCIIGVLVFSYELGHEEGYLAGFKEGLDEGVSIAEFRFYYVKPKQRFGVDELLETLEGLRWTVSYRVGEFDCSEMSAYLEWYLENNGWHTLIVVGDCPFAEGGHTWLLVETSPDRWLPVEATNIEAVLPKSPHFDGYFKYDRKFESIQDALDYSEDEFDWWNP